MNETIEEVRKQDDQIHTILELQKVIKNIERSTNNFDDSCDCPLSDGEDGLHHKNCKTMELRNEFDSVIA